MHSLFQAPENSESYLKATLLQKKKALRLFFWR